MRMVQRPGPGRQTDSHSSRTGPRNLHLNQHHKRHTPHTLPYSGGVNAGSLYHRGKRRLANSTGAGARLSGIFPRSTYICSSCQHEIQEHKLFGYLNPRESLEATQTSSPYLILRDNDQIPFINTTLPLNQPMLTEFLQWARHTPYKTQSPPAMS